MKAQRRILLALVALFFMLFAACGGDDDSGDDVASIDEDAAEDSGDDEEEGGGEGDAPTEQEFQDAFLEYAQCMRDHGVDMEDPTFEDGGGVLMGGGAANPGDPASEQAFAEADEACKHIIDAVAPQEQISPEEQAELQDQMLEVAQCMRDKGHDMPDPEVDENGNITVRAEAAPGGENDTGTGPSEEFQDDMTDCEDEAGVERPEGPTGADGEEQEEDS